MWLRPLNNILSDATNVGVLIHALEKLRFQFLELYYYIAIPNSKGHNLTIFNNKNTTTFCNNSFNQIFECQS